MDSFKTSAPAPPSNTSELPSPEATIVKVSALPVAVIVSVPELPIRLKPVVPLARLISILKPPVPTVKLAVPSLIVAAVAE